MYHSTFRSAGSLESSRVQVIFHGGLQFTPHHRTARTLQRIQFHYRRMFCLRVYHSVCISSLPVGIYVISGTRASRVDRAGWVCCSPLSHARSAACPGTSHSCPSHIITIAGPGRRQCSAQALLFITTALSFLYLQVSQNLRVHLWTQRNTKKTQPALG